LAKAGAIDGTETANPVPIIDAITKGLRPGEEVQYGRKKYEIEPEQFDDLEPCSKTDARQKEDIHLNVDGKAVKVASAFEIEDEGGSIDVSTNVDLPAVGEHGYQIAKDFQLHERDEEEECSLRNMPNFLHLMKLEHGVMMKMKRDWKKHLAIDML